MAHNQHAEFVDTHFEALIQRCTSVMSIADKLYEKRAFSWEVYSKITNATRANQKRELSNIVKSGGRDLKSAFYQVLQELQPDVIQELGGSSSQTRNENRASESHRRSEEPTRAQNMPDSPEDAIIRWSPSSIKHRSKIEELRKDSSRKKVGSIYFSKSNNYMIGSGGSGMVYLGLKEDGTEVAIKRICKDPQNSKDFENELKHLRDLNLESKNIVRYVDLAEDDDFYYLALQLCENDLVEHMKSLNQEERNNKEFDLRKIVQDVLLGLQVLHRAGVIHRDIKPKNVLIDSGKNARLADFGLSRKLEEGRSAVHTARAGTQGWEATEILNQSEKSDYKKSSDIQVAGMLVYYILSDGKHPFGGINDREDNIRKGKCCLDHIQDIVAKDLIEWMINKDPAKRLNIDEVLIHPYFLDEHRKYTIHKELGDRPEIQKYETLANLYNLYKDKGYTEGTEPTATLALNDALSELKIKDEKTRLDISTIVGKDLENLWRLFSTAEKITEGKSFSNWKSVLSEIWKNLNKKPPEDVLGLLRVLRNKQTHENVRKEFEDKKIFDLFPDYFISLHRVAKELGWNY